MPQRTSLVKADTASSDRSHALRGNASMDALRPLWDAERLGLHSFAARGNDQEQGFQPPDAAIGHIVFQG